MQFTIKILLLAILATALGLNWYRREVIVRRIIQETRESVEQHESQMRWLLLQNRNSDQDSASQQPILAEIEVLQKLESDMQQSFQSLTERRGDLESRDAMVSVRSIPL